jgi:diguanylate cyclase (GGDEF)-like protein/PAS domain S-box-containing protein
MKIWVRLVVAILLSVVVSGIGLIFWATLEQQRISQVQARDFANSVHQMTMAGLTGMMFTGTVYQRHVFLDQIKAMDQIKSLNVVRSDAVVVQFGRGFDREKASDPAELRVLQDGVPFFEILSDASGDDYLRAIIPAVAQENYLGKNCLACHTVGSGTVLGAVTMEISLAKSTQSIRMFARNAILAGMAVCVPLALFIWFFISRMVSTPLAKMTEGLNQIVDGDIDEKSGLPVHRLDEVGIATVSFNKVLAKATELLKQQRLSRMVFDNSLEGITVTDASSRIVMVNRAFTHTTGYSAEEAIGQTPALLKSGRQGPDFYARFWNALREDDGWHGEIWNKRKNGEVYPQWISVTAVRNRKKQIEHYIAIFADITERKERENLMEYQALHDALTGLPNRRLFHDHLNQTLVQIKRHGSRMFAVMYLDLDRFKYINDTWGHDAGDMLLKEVAARLRRCVRESDTVARLGGDEFTILLPEISGEADAGVVAEKILLAMKVPVNLTTESRVITTSIGISVSPRDGVDAETLMKRADAAMYQVKASGRAGISFYTEELSNNAPVRE